MSGLSGLSGPARAARRTLLNAKDFGGYFARIGAFWRGFESVQTVAAGSELDCKRRAAGSAKLGVAHRFRDVTNGLVRLNGQDVHGLLAWGVPEIAGPGRQVASHPMV